MVGLAQNSQNSQKNSSSAGKIFAVDITSGAPQEGVTLKGKQHEGVTNKEGMMAVPTDIRRAEFRATRGNDRYSPMFSYYRYENRARQKRRGVGNLL